MSSRTQLVDSFGRIATDLRISLTDRCNLRCTYCMPADGMDWIPRGDLLTRPELTRLAEIFRTLGVCSVRLTGGEPLVRADVAGVVADLSRIGFEDISMTTNGVLLAAKAEALVKAGLHRVNVSVDSLVADRFALITRRNSLPAVLNGIAVASEAGLAPIKLNCVLVPDINDDEILDFVALARSGDHHVRFIENMPLDAEQNWRPEKVVSGHSVLSKIAAVHSLTPRSPDSSPAVVFDFTDGAPGSIGFISSVTEPFCSTCDRLRLTADGFLRTCLFALDEVDLRGPLRNGADDAALKAIVIEAVAGKWAGHKIGNANFIPSPRAMSAVGG